MDNYKMKQIIQDHIKAGEFYEVQELAKKITQDELFLILRKLAYQEGVAVYAFICFLISQENKAEYHSLAAHLLALPLCAYPGACSAGLFHAREAVRLDPEDVTNKELLLYFNRIPEQVLEKDEAIAIAKEVLRQKPDSEAAKEVLLAYELFWQ